MSFIIERLKEPSTWAGIGILLSWFAPYLGLSVDRVQMIIAAGSMICAGVSMGMKEKK